MPLSSQTSELLEAATIAATNALALDPIAVDMTGVSPFNDVYLIVTADNPRHLRAVKNAIEDELHRDLGVDPLNVEGDETSEWILLNYGDVAVHVFLEEARGYYALEKLWNRSPRVDLSDAIPAAG